MLTVPLVLAILTISLGITSPYAARGDPGSYTVSFTTDGLPSFYSIGVWVDGAYNATIHGGQTWGPYIVSDATSHTITVSGYAPDGYPYYSGYPWYSGYSWVAFYCPDNSWSFSSEGSHTFYYITLFYLQIQSEHGHASGTGWYAAGAWARISAKDIVPESTGTQYRFDSWSGAAFSLDPHQAANSVFMDSPKTIVANWVTQYKLTVSSPYGNPVGDNWYDAGSSASASVTTPVDAGTGTRYVFTGWTGDLTSASPTVTIAMNAPHSLTANWKTQHYLTINANEGTVDHNSDWFDEDSSITISASSVSNEITNKSRLSFKGWSGDVTSTSLSVTIYMDTPKTLTADWNVQYYLRVISPFGTATGEGWYNAGSTASFSVSPTDVPIDIWGYLGAKHVFSSWTGDTAAASSTSTIIMDGPKTVTAVWKDDYVWTYAAASVFTGVAVFGAAVWKRSAITPHVRPFVRRLYKKKGSGVSGEPVLKPTPEPVSTTGLVRACPRCRTELAEKAEYCTECGEKLV
jgi:uncharacterized repeat protein (TIGR02543 family)